MTYISFVLGLILLVVGGDILVKGAVRLAKKMHLSPLLIGIVLIGFGTSTPELIASLLAVLQTPPATGIAVGNVIGSNIANILLVLGLAAFLRPIEVDKKSFRRDSLFLVISTVALIVAIVAGVITPWLGGVMVALLIFYIWYSYHSESKAQRKEIESEMHTYSKMSIMRSFLMTVGGILITMAGAQMLVKSAIEIAQNWGISESIIGLTLVAVGTSLPELSASVMASIRKQNAVAFGNVVGSNIYNALFILGVVALVKPITVPPDVLASLAVMVGATILLLVCGRRPQLGRVVGASYLILYVGYILWLAQS